MIDNAIRKLVCYGKEKSFFPERDTAYVTNRILEILKLDGISCEENYTNVNLEETLNEILNFAVSSGLIEDSIVYKDLLDTALMGAMLPRPSEVTDKFYSLYNSSPEEATHFFYTFSKDSDYIRRYRIAKDVKWKTETEYGELDITINLSKPEKDPKAIAAAKNAPSSSYPKCMLCKECEGYAGRINFPARQNHRIIPVLLDNTEYFLQYSPYVYYNEHCIVLNSEHTPMVVNASLFKKLLSFTEQFPHYFVGSNADLPIVGGSILSHDHFQGGSYTFAMERAPIETEISFNGFDDIKAGIVKWPMSVIRLSGENAERIVSLAEIILEKWRSYTDKDAFIFAQTNGEPHNTITPIARRSGNNFELDLVLRNNITTDEHPLGVFHPHAELHHIKKENIGLIEVMGLAVLPARLKEELSLLGKAIIENKDISSDETLSKHSAWVKEIKQKHSNLNADNIDEILKLETGLVFAKVLEHAGVFKRTKEGKEAFMRFIRSI